MIAYMRYDNNPSDGIDANDPMVTFASIKDGTSNTALYSEFVSGDTSKNDPANKAHQKYQVHNHWATGNNTAAVRQNCLTNTAGFDNGRWGMKGGGWAASFMQHGSVYNHTMLPNERSCNCFIDGNTGEGGDDWYGRNLFAASSEHPGGVNVALADGSVRLVSESVAPDVWWGLGTRNGGEAVQLP
jgi:prepilin-type processing-associated H-X9-DG protein